VAHLLDSFGAIQNLEPFVSTHGRRFYGVEHVGNQHIVVLQRSPMLIKDDFVRCAEEKIVPFWANKTINWKLQFDSCLQ